MKNLLKSLRNSDVKKLQLINFVSGMLFYTPIMTLFLLQRGIEVGFLIIAQTMFSVAMMLGELPTGILADKYGQINSIRAGLLLDATGMLQLLLLHNKIALLAFFAVRGLSVALRSGIDEALLYESYLKENGSAEGYSKTYGKFLTRDILGFVAATATSGLAVQLFGKAAFVPLIIMTAIIMMASLALTFAIKNKPAKKKTKRDFNSLNHLKSSLKLVKGNRTIFALTLAGLLTLNGEYFLRQSYQPYFQTYKVPAIFLGAALSLGKLLNYLVIHFSHKLENIFTVDQIIFWINMLTGILFVTFSVFKNPIALVALFILLQGLFNAERPVVSDYVNQQIESHQRSTVLSAVSFSLNFGQIFIRIALGLSVGLLGIGSTYMVQGAYLILGTIIGVWYLRSCGCIHRVRHSPQVAEESILTI